MKKFFGHLSTITKHRHAVIRHCAKSGIFFQGLMHDMSKYSPTEFKQGIKYYTGTKSPNEGERAEYGYSLAWMHHKGRNRHHYEYWTDVDMASKSYKPVPMPINFLTEMFCDRIAASKIYQGDKYTDASAYNYFMRGNAKTTMHPETAKKLEEWLTLLRDEGEEVAFRQVKKENREYRKHKKKKK